MTRRGLTWQALSDEITGQSVPELEDYPGQAEAHMRKIKAVLGAENRGYAI